MTERRSSGPAKRDTRPSRPIANPQPGYFKVRFVKGGPEVGARIARICSCTVGGDGPHDWTPACDRFPPLTCFVDGVERPERLYSVWTSGDDIDEATYRYMVDGAAWDRVNDRSAPAANPGNPIDLLTNKPVF